MAPRNVCAMAGSPTESTNNTAKISLRIILPHNRNFKTERPTPLLGGMVENQMTMQRCLDGNSRLK
jgi:hypothetical protein